MQDVRHVQELSSLIDSNPMFENRLLFKIDQTGAYRQVKNSKSRKLIYTSPG